MCTCDSFRAQHYAYVHICLGTGVQSKIAQRSARICRLPTECLGHLQHRLHCTTRLYLESHWARPYTNIAHYMYIIYTLYIYYILLSTDPLYYPIYCILYIYIYIIIHILSYIIIHIHYPILSYSLHYTYILLLRAISLSTY